MRKLHNVYRPFIAKSEISGNRKIRKKTAEHMVIKIKTIRKITKYSPYHRAEGSYNYKG